MPYFSSTTWLFNLSILSTIASAMNLSHSSIGHHDRVHPRDLPVKRSTDCGTWTMYCGGVPTVGGGRGQKALGACNNACYYINKVDPLFVARYKSGIDNGKNRIQSGCQTQQGSVCNHMPFSQRFHDPFESTYQPNPADYKYNCDEFPMAAMSQDDFGTDGRKPNSLRCIDAMENSAMGRQLSAFIGGEYEGLKGRTCPEGELPDDSTFKIVFNYDGVEGEDVKIYMTELRGGSSGRINFPYQPDNDNRYAIATTGKDVLPCTVDILRDTDNEYQIAVTYGNGNDVNFVTGNIASPQQVLTVPGKNGYLDLNVLAEGPAKDEDSEYGSEIQFNYVPYGVGDFIDGTSFFWTTSSTGTDGSLSNQPLAFVVTKPGGYCYRSPFEDSGSGKPSSQGIKCYFPCNAP